MSVVSAEIEGGFDRLAKNAREGYFIEKVAAISAATASGRFAAYLRNQRFHKYFKDRTGDTRKSIGSYRGKGKNPAYVVRAGVGISESLNYLAGLYRGKTKNFDYPGGERDLIKGGFEAWGGQEKVKAITEEALEKMIAEAEKK